MSDNPEVKLKDTTVERNGQQSDLSGSALDLLKAGRNSKNSTAFETENDTPSDKKTAFPKLVLEGRKEDPKETNHKEARLEHKKESEAQESTSLSSQFLKAHPELTISKQERKRLLDEYNNLSDKRSDNKLQLSELERKQEELLKDMAADGVTTIDQFNKLPQKKQEEYLKRRNELFEPDSKISKIDKLRQEMESDRHKQHLIEAKLDFQSELKMLDMLPKEKQADIMKSLNTILDKSDKTQTTNLTDAERLEITQGVVHQLAYPESIKQGNKNTCALASVEGILARDFPDVYARAAAELATQGELRTFAGHQLERGQGIKITDTDIHQDDGNPDRSLVSKILQTGLAKAAAAEDGKRYENHKPGEAPLLTPDPEDPLHRTTPVDDTGERLVDLNKKDADGKPVVEDWPGLSGDQQADLLSKVTGERFIFEKIPVNSPIALAEAIEAQAKEHGYPLKIGFGYPSPNDDENHAILVTGIDHTKSPPEVIYSDSAQDKDEAQTMPIDEFYRTALKGEYYLTDDEGKKHTQLRGPFLGDPEYDPYIAIIHR